MMVVTAVATAVATAVLLLLLLLLYVKIRENPGRKHLSFARQVREKRENRSVSFYILSEALQL